MKLANVSRVLRTGVAMIAQRPGLAVALLLQMWAGLTSQAAEGEGLRLVPYPSPKPLLKDFMAINGHFTFKPELYRQVGRLVRNYHNVNWDVKQPGDPITVPICVNKVNWKNDVYGRWQKAGYETDICIQFSGFQTDAKDYQRFWTGQEAWCYDYGKAMAGYFGPSGREKLCTSH